MNNVLCISGGGVKGIAMLGATHYLAYDSRMLDNVNVYIGTSIGSVIALLLCMGLTPMQLFTKICKIDDFLSVDILNFLNFTKTYGLLDITQFIKLVENVIIEKFGFIPTLKELYDLTGKRLIIVQTNATKSRTEYFDFETEPDCSCALAVKMSCSLPIIFEKVEYNDCLYVDGGVSDNFAIEYASKYGNVIGIRSVSSKGDIEDLFGYIHRLFSIPVNKIEDLQCNKIDKSKHTIIEVDTTSMNTISLKTDSDTKMSMFCQGYECAKKTFK